MNTREEYYPHGILRMRHHYHDSHLHRDDGPAVEFYHNCGALYSSVWYRHGHRHREDGPAQEYFSTDGTRIGVVYYLDNEYCSKQEYGRYVTLLHFSRILGLGWGPSL